MVVCDDNDLHLLALCIWREARGEGLVGMRAVANVICNRVGAEGFAATLHDVIMGKNQFSSMSRPTDQQFNLIPSDDNTFFQQAQLIAQQAVGGTNDITHGSRYYANLRTMDADGWFARNIVDKPAIHPHAATIGQHDFYV